MRIAAARSRRALQNWLEAVAGWQEKLSPPSWTRRLSTVSTLRVSSEKLEGKSREAEEEAGPVSVRDSVLVCSKWLWTSVWRLRLRVLRASARALSCCAPVPQATKSRLVLEGQGGRRSEGAGVLGPCSRRFGSRRYASMR